MTEKLQPSNLDSIGDGNMSWSWPSGLKSLSEGRISSTKTEADEVDTQEQHRLEIAEQIDQNGSNEPPPNHDNKVVKRDTENSSSKKRKKLASKSFKGRMLKSKVWKEFEKCKGDDGTELAICKHCKKKFDGSSKKGTTHLNNHLKRCKARKSKEEAGDQAVKAKPVIDQDLKHLDVRRMVIQHWAPSLNDMWNDVMEVFNEEMEKVYKCLDTLTCRCSLSIIWFADDYYFLVAHFITDDWERKKKIIDFQRAFDFENFDNNFVKEVQDLLLKWNLDENVSSIVRNQGKKQEEFNEINCWLSKRGSLPFCGQWLTDDNWLDDILVHSIRKEAKELAEKITELFDYVSRLPSSSDYYMLAYVLRDLRSAPRCDCIPLWLMSERNLFENAQRFKKKFYGKEWTDLAIKSRNLTDEEWDKTTAIYKCLEMLIDAIRSLFEGDYTTANVYFPKVCDIYTKLLRREKSKNDHIERMVSLMRAEFVRKYWSSYSLFLAIAAVLDPRFKMDIVQHWYRKIYGSEADAELNNLKHSLTVMFNEYFRRANSSSSFKMVEPYASSDVTDNVASKKSELDRYLDEPKFASEEEINILLWWRANSANFPTLARMAREYLAIPISISASPMDFDTKLRIAKLINSVRHGNLDFDDLFRAFVCTNCWLLLD